MDYVTVAKLQGKLDGEANQSTVRKLIDKMVQDGYIKNSANRRLGTYLNLSVWSQPFRKSVWNLRCLDCIFCSRVICSFSKVGQPVKMFIQ